MAFRNRFAVAAVILLSLTLFAISAIAATEGASGARYVVAQCGWRVGQDASWIDSSGKFSKSTYCQPPSSANALDGVHLISQVKNATNSVDGTRIARWRWQAPAGTGIVNVHGQRWQHLKEGFQHRLGGIPANGTFTPTLTLDKTDATKRDFWHGFSPFVQAFEARFGCFRSADKKCESKGTILAGLRALTISIDDAVKPSSQISGPLTGAAWLRGTQSVTFNNKDTGAGLHFAQTLVDGAIRESSEMNCAKTKIAGQWRGTKMQPCPLSASGTHRLDTKALSDGQHTLRHCAVDFADSSGCAADRKFRIDNNPPAAPRGLKVEGGEEWRRTNGFDLTWSNPPQGVASPIVSSSFRVAGPNGHAGGPWNRTEGSKISGIQVPAPGEYKVRVWLTDEAGNTDERNESEVTLRYDNVPPTGYFNDPSVDDPELMRVPVADQYSGVAGGSIQYRASTGSEWHDLPTQFRASGDASLVARFPSDLPRGTWVLRAAIADRAGNLTVTDRRANGSLMTVKTPLKDETVLSAGLVGQNDSGRASLEIDYGTRARINGRLAGVESGGISGAELIVTERPQSGSRAGVTTHKVQTDARGHFEHWLAPGPGRQVAVAFAGTKRLEASIAPALELKVRGSLSFRARPQKVRTGQRVYFRGRVHARDAWHPLKGNLVQVQYFERSAQRWRPVILIRTDRNGYYRSNYRFRYITGSARIKLRALLVPAARFPYSGAASKTLTVTVKGAKKVKRPR